jgi:hypothetical protein
MLRPLQTIIAALQIANPSLSSSTAESYARVLRAEAHKRGFDPLTVVAITWHESRVIASTVGGAAGRCYGLGQICVQAVYPHCRGEAFHGARCVAERQRLLVGTENLRTIAAMITTWRAYCRRATGKPALFHRWLAGYQGIDIQGTTCGMKKTRRGFVDAPRHPMTKAVMKKRLQLIDKLGLSRADKAR